MKGQRCLIYVLGILIPLATIGIWFLAPNDDPQGGAGLWCDNEELPSVRNSSDWIVTWHNTVCSGFGGNSAIYIYVHRIDEREDRENLIFRYFEHGGANLPKIEWLPDGRLLIKVDHVSQITKKIPKIDSINIEYEIREEDYKFHE
jgi:hypothetical protein